jgi:hypothetical protein
MTMAETTVWWARLPAGAIEIGDRWLREGATKCASRHPAGVPETPAQSVLRRRSVPV